MESEHEQSASQFSNTNDDFARGTLESAESHVKSSTAASYACDASRSAFSASFEAFIDWGQKNELIHPKSDFYFFTRPPYAAGDEHEVWFEETSNRVFKATFENEFGVGWTNRESANASEYLTRLVLQNKYFGDDIQLISIVQCESKIRVLTSQPHISGNPAPYEEIQDWFGYLGFRRMENNGCVAWYSKEANLLVADAHEGNVIRSFNGELIPIDLNIIQPSGALLEWVSNYQSDDVDL